LFLLIAGVLLWRVRTGDHPHPWILAGFSSLVLFSGVICFFLEANWFVRKSLPRTALRGLRPSALLCMHAVADCCAVPVAVLLAGGVCVVSDMRPGWKVPLYGVIGVSLCFALLFSVIDIINYCTGKCEGVCGCCHMTRALIETETQVYLVVGTAMVMGLVFGLVFGLFDLEDVKLADLRVALMREESVCYPIGMALGALSAVINQWLRANKNTAHYDPVATDDKLDDADFVRTAQHCTSRRLSSSPPH
jgi:hypothetical protein